MLRCLDDISREVRDIQDSVSMHLPHVEQVKIAHRLLLSSVLESFAGMVTDRLKSMEKLLSQVQEDVSKRKSFMRQTIQIEHY